MIRRALPAVAALAAFAALLSGCAARPAAPSASPSSVPTTTPTITPLVTPTATAEEVTRSVLDGGTIDDPTGAMPASGQIAVDVACWGADGSTMAWRLVAGDGTPLGLSGTADCSGPPTTSWLGVTATKRPAEVRVRIVPTSGAVSGYAIVRRGTP